jgi:hypothetical protein
MSPRFRAALVQLVAFLGGSVVAPVWHLARHPPDHTHGPGGSTVTFHVHGAEADHDHEVARSLPAREPAKARRAHSHPGMAPAHDHAAERPAEGAPGPPAPRSEHGPCTSHVPIPLEHGHGSLAHFGLALLGAPPVVPVPEPEPTPDVVVVPRLAALRLLQPSFPRPRPPPPVA